MDMLQLVFGFVNAPLFAIFLLGMFWRRATGHGAFFGLLIGTLTAAFFHGNTLPAGETAGLLKGGWMGVHQTFASSMAQSFWMAIFAFSGCFLGTLFISLATKPNRVDDELQGLVYSLTEKPRDPRGTRWYGRPVVLGGLVLGATFVLNLIFW
jgi:SSS family solute:Na+ symporter